MDTITIDARFCGPPESGNGGYVAGMLANRSARPVRVMLRRPPPLNVPMVVRHNGEHLELKHDGELIAEAEPFEPDLPVPAAPAYVEALQASRDYSGFRQHPFPGCFVCGPQRARGDGLRIFPGRLGDTQYVAAPWIPDESLCAGDGKVHAQFIWAALDCPGYFAAANDGRVMLLGRIAARIDRRVHAEESCIVLGCKLGSEGRKHHVATLLYDDDGELCAGAMATWIEPAARAPQPAA